MNWNMHKESMPNLLDSFYGINKNAAFLSTVQI